MDNIFSLLLAGRMAHCFLATDLGSQGETSDRFTQHHTMKNLYI